MEKDKDETLLDKIKQGLKNSWVGILLILVFTLLYIFIDKYENLKKIWADFHPSSQTPRDTATQPPYDTVYGPKPVAPTTRTINTHSPMVEYSKDTVRLPTLPEPEVKKGTLILYFNRTEVGKSIFINEKSEGLVENVIQDFMLPLNKKYTIKVGDCKESRIDFTKNNQEEAYTCKN